MYRKTRKILNEMQQSTAGSVVWLWNVDNEKEAVDMLNAFEMWVWRRMEKVSWQEKKTNEEVILRAVGGEMCCTSSIQAEKNWIGHVVQGTSLLKLVVEGRMLGKKPRGRPGIEHDWWLKLRGLHRSEKKGWIQRQMEGMDAKDPP